MKEYNGCLLLNEVSYELFSIAVYFIYIKIFKKH